MRKPMTAAAVLLLAVAGCTDSSADRKTESSASASHSHSGHSQATPVPTPTGAGAIAWIAPGDPLHRAVVAGLRPGVKEHLAFHVHSHLDIFIDGKPVTVPAGIGINIDDPGVQTFPEPDGSVTYGGIEECSTPCISPLHTHDTTGIVHTESLRHEPNTLGQFFIEFGVRLSASCVRQYCAPIPIAFYVNGKRYTQDPATIQLTDHREIAIVIGTPPARIPATADFSRA